MPHDAIDSVVGPSVGNRPQPLDRPIFLVGHARAGSTILPAMLLSHPDIGPKPAAVADGGLREPTDDLTSLLNLNVHLRFTAKLEHKDVWFAPCGGKDVFTHMGRELIGDETCALAIDLTRLR